MLSGASFLSDVPPGMGSVGDGGLHSPGGGSWGMPTSPTSLENQQMLTALQKFLLNNNSEEDESWAAVDVYACDEFRMFEFKVRRCMRGRSHDWTECPFAHPGEKARRRDPRRFHYSGTACPDFRKGSCRRGDACEFAHGVFECWLHPARYRTQPCKDGRSCRRRVCFFAHTQEQLRLLPGAAQAASVARNVLSTSQATALAACLSQSGASLSGYESCSSPRYDGSPRTSVAGTFDGGVSFDGSRGLAQCGYDGVALSASSLCGQYGSFNDASVCHCCASQVSSPTSTLVGHTMSPPPLSPPLSPTASPASPSSPHSWPSSYVPHSSSNLMHHASANLMQQQQTTSKGMSDLIATLQQLDLRGGGGVSPLWLQAQAQQVAAQSAQYSSGPSPLRRCSQSVPCTPTKLRWEGKEQHKHPWDTLEVEEEQNVQRVLSGRDLRSKMFGKLGKDNRLDGGEAPDLGWVNELVQEDPDQEW